MGHFHGLHTKLKFKPDADPKAKQLFKDLSASNDNRNRTQLEEKIKDNPYVQAILGQEWWTQWCGGEITLWGIAWLSTVLVGSGSYSNYNKFKIEGDDYEFFGSSRDDGLIEMRFLLNAMKDQLVVEDGQIVFRQIYDNNSEPENVIWWDAQAQVFKESAGWQFGDSWEDKTNPGYDPFEFDDHRTLDPFTQIFIPPMNLMEVCKQQGREFTREVPDWKAVCEERAKQNEV